MTVFSAPLLLPGRRTRPLRWTRILVAVGSVVALASLDTTWKALALLAGRAPLDTPTGLVKPVGTMAAWLIALGAVLLLPSICVPGALLVASGVGSNLFSLALWHAAPDPLSLHLGAGVLHFNLADVTIAGGALLLVVSVLCTPADRFG